MELEEAHRRLLIAHQKQKVLRKEIELLRNIIWEQGGNPDDPGDELQSRNKAIYQQYRNGSSFSYLSKQYKITPGQVRYICRRMRVASL